MSILKSSIWKPAPELAIPDIPALLCDSEDLWLSYALAYRTTKCYAVVQFLDVIDHRLSPINDEGLNRHPCFSAGLQFYAFNEVTGSPETFKWFSLKARHWVITFKDNTLDVIAGDAKVLAHDLTAENPTSALLNFLGKRNHLSSSE
jgi:hypothetical protein